MPSADENETAMLNEAREQVAIADQKAGVILAAQGIGFGAVLAGFLAGSWSPLILTGLSQVFWWIGALASLGSVGLCAAVLWPRFTTRDLTGGINYWGHVSRYKELSDLEAALDTAPPFGGKRTRHQLWRVSTLLSVKYQLIRFSLGCSGLAVVMFLVSVGTARTP